MTLISYYLAHHINLDFLLTLTFSEVKQPSYKKYHKDVSFLKQYSFIYENLIIFTLTKLTNLVLFEKNNINSFMFLCIKILKKVISNHIINKKLKTHILR